MFIQSFYLTSKLIIHSPQSSGVFLRAIRPSLPFSTALTNGSKLLRMEKKSVQYFWISRKRSTRCLILRSWQNYTLGLNEYILRWFNNYLSNRVQSVVGSESDPAEVPSGVPQGSVLGPLLFLIYIDDLPSVLHNLGPEVNLFADDVLLYHVVSKEEDFALVQEAVSLLDNWSVDNHLNFNLTKCKYMIISRKLHPTLPNTPLLLSNHPLQRVFCYKYLGLLLTDNLSWSQHISSCSSKARQVLGLLYRRFYSFSNQETLKQLYLSLVRPHIEYGCQVWDPHLAKDKKALEDVQKFGL